MTSPRRSRVGLAVLIIATLTIMACRKPQPAPPPPPAAATTPTPPPPAPAITLRAQPTTLDRGQATTLAWETRNAGTVRIEPGVGEVPVNGNRQVTPTSSVTYTATATGPGGSATDTARITVNAPPPPPTTSAPPRPTVTADPLDAFRREVQDIFFDYDKADIRPGETDKLRNATAFLRQNANIRFTIEGHCDERGSEEYNLGLGDRRANAVKEFLMSQGIPISRINTVSYGEERPQCRNETEECFQMNRRAHFTVNP